MASQSQSDFEKLDFSIQSQVLASDLFNRSQTIALYFSHHQEVSTQLLFKDSQSKGKKIAYPRVVEENSPLAFYWVNSEGEFSTSKWGLQEPDEKLGAQRASLSEIDLLVMPGVAFDRCGYRLGRGKGFYDRTLNGFLGQRLGLAYSFQLLSQLPHDAWDEKVGWIATENEWIRVS